MTATIQSMVPILASLDFEVTLDFYCNKLGFEQLHWADDYLIVGRDDVELHFWLCSERYVAEHTACYVHTEDIGALHKSFQAKGLKVRTPVQQPWHMKEMIVIDPHGNLLRFGEPTRIRSAVRMPQAQRAREMARVD